jgi:lipopolysaccharide export system protein LptC
VADPVQEEPAQPEEALKQVAREARHRWRLLTRKATAQTPSQTSQLSLVIRSELWETEAAQDATQHETQHGKLRDQHQYVESDAPVYLHEQNQEAGFLHDH